MDVTIAVPMKINVHLHPMSRACLLKLDYNKRCCISNKTRQGQEMQYLTFDNKDSSNQELAKLITNKQLPSDQLTAITYYSPVACLQTSPPRCDDDDDDNDDN